MRIINRMGEFHITICMMRCIHSRFKGFGFPELLSEVGLGGSGTIENALKGGDVKGGIRYYKILFEAIFRIKIEAMGILSNGIIIGIDLERKKLVCMTWPSL